MQKFVLFLLFVIFSVNPVLADSSQGNDANWGICPQHPQDSSQPGEAEEAVWEGERDSYIYNNYGEENSSSYLNRSRIDAYESNHGGDDFDLSD